MISGAVKFAFNNKLHYDVLKNFVINFITLKDIKADKEINKMP